MAGEGIAPVRPVILLIEDDPAIRRFLKTGLTAINALVHEGNSVHTGLVEWRSRRPDVVILDLGLPDGEGIGVISEIRSTAQTPIIVLSARSEEQGKIEALDAGADDYLTKPFSYGELLARIRVALRHAATRNRREAASRFIQGPLNVDLQNRTVHFDGVPVHLTPIQFRLLQVLIQSAGRVVTQKQLLREVWGESHRDNSHYLRIYMSQLRHKLELDPTQPRILLTEVGIGYRIADEPELQVR